MSFGMLYLAFLGHFLQSSFPAILTRQANIKVVRINNPDTATPLAGYFGKCCG